MTCTKPNVTP